MFKDTGNADKMKVGDYVFLGDNIPIGMVRGITANGYYLWVNIFDEPVVRPWVSARLRLATEEEIVAYKLEN